MNTRIATFIFLLGSLFCALEAVNYPLPNPLPIHEAFAPKFTDVIPPIAATKAPPSPVVENIPAQPSSDLVWIPGYWIWLEGKNDFAWICGVWRRPPPKLKWIPGKWTSIDGQWIREQGFWSAVAIEKLPIYEKAPPNSIEEKLPSAKGDDYFWIPGFWTYSYPKNDYVWISGKWEAFHDSWILAPATYVWRTNGYLFVPPYWDWALQERGFAYLCNAIEDPTLIDIKMIVHHLYCFYPDYKTLFWHSWHFHPEWWNGCSCIPDWWFWQDWWTFSWNNMWGCWWWWSHPGSAPPYWMTYDLSMQIAPPSYSVMELFAYLKKPPFSVKTGNQPLDPLRQTGTSRKMIVPKPSIASDITPDGTIRPPPLPEKQGHQIIFPSTPETQSKDSTYMPKYSENSSYQRDNFPVNGAATFPEERQNPSQNSYFPGDTPINNSRYTDYPNNNYNESPSNWPPTSNSRATGAPSYMPSPTQSSYYPGDNRTNNSRYTDYPERTYEPSYWPSSSDSNANWPPSNGQSSTPNYIKNR